MFILNCVRQFLKCYALINNVNGALVLIGGQLPARLPIRSRVRNEFTNTKKLAKKLARKEASSSCRQQFANMFADCNCTVHTHAHQLEVFNTSLPSLVCRGMAT